MEVNFKDGASTGTISIVHKDEKGVESRYALFEIGMRSRPIGDSPTLEIKQTNFMAVALSRDDDGNQLGTDVTKWPPYHAKKYYNSEIDRLKEELSNTEDPPTEDQKSALEAKIVEHEKELKKADNKEEETMYTFTEFLTEEEVELDEKRKPLTLQQRQKKKMSFRRSRMKRKISMEKNRKKLASKEKLLTRTDKKERMRVIARLFPALAKKSRSQWSNSEKRKAEQIVIDNQAKIKTFAKRMYKDVRKAEVERLQKYRANRAKMT